MPNLIKIFLNDVIKFINIEGGEQLSNEVSRLQSKTIPGIVANGTSYFELNSDGQTYTFDKDLTYYFRNPVNSELYSNIEYIYYSSTPKLSTHVFNGDSFHYRVGCIEKVIEGTEWRRGQININDNTNGLDRLTFYNSYPTNSVSIRVNLIPKSYHSNTYLNFSTLEIGCKDSPLLDWGRDFPKVKVYLEGSNDYRITGGSFEVDELYTTQCLKKRTNTRHIDTLGHYNKGGFDGNTKFDVPHESSTLYIDFDRSYSDFFFVTGSVDSEDYLYITAYDQNLQSYNIYTNWDKPVYGSLKESNLFNQIKYQSRGDSLYLSSIASDHSHNFVLWHVKTSTTRLKIEYATSIPGSSVFYALYGISNYGLVDLTKCELSSSQLITFNYQNEIINNNNNNQPPQQNNNFIDTQPKQTCICSNQPIFGTPTHETDNVIPTSTVQFQPNSCDVNIMVKVYRVDRWSQGVRDVSKWTIEFINNSPFPVYDLSFTLNIAPKESWEMVQFGEVYTLPAWRSTSPLHTGESHKAGLIVDNIEIIDVVILESNPPCHSKEQPAPIITTPSIPTSSQQTIPHEQIQNNEALTDCGLRYFTKSATKMTNGQYSFVVEIRNESPTPLSQMKVLMNPSPLEVWGLEKVGENLYQLPAWRRSSTLKPNEFHAFGYSLSSLSGLHYHVIGCQETNEFINPIPSYKPNENIKPRYYDPSEYNRPPVFTEDQPITSSYLPPVDLDNPRPTYTSYYQQPTYDLSSGRFYYPSSTTDDNEDISGSTTSIPTRFYYPPPPIDETTFNSFESTTSPVTQFEAPIPLTTGDDNDLITTTSSNEQIPQELITFFQTGSTTGELPDFGGGVFQETTGISFNENPVNSISTSTTGQDQPSTTLSAPSPTTSSTNGAPTFPVSTSGSTIATSINTPTEIQPTTTGVSSTTSVTTTFTTGTPPRPTFTDSIDTLTSSSDTPTPTQSNPTSTIPLDQTFSTTGIPTPPTDSDQHGQTLPTTGHHNTNPPDLELLIDSSSSSPPMSAPTSPKDINQHGMEMPTTIQSSSTTSPSSTIPSTTTLSPTKPEEINQNDSILPPTTNENGNTPTTNGIPSNPSTTSTAASPTKPDEPNENGDVNTPLTTGTSSTTSTTSPIKPNEPNENGDVNIPLTTGTSSTTSTTSPTSTTSTTSSTTTLTPTKPDELNENGIIPTTTGTPSAPSTTSSPSSTTTSSPTKPDELNENGSIPSSTTSTPSTPSTTSPIKPDEPNQNGDVNIPLTTGTSSTTSTTSSPTFTTSTTTTASTSSPTNPDELNENGSIIPPTTTGKPSTTGTASSPTKPDETNQNGSIPPSTTSTPPTPSTTSSPSSTTTSSPTRPDELNENGSIPPTTTGTPSTTSTTLPTSATSPASSTTTSSPTKPDELNQNGSIPPTTTGTPSNPSTTSSPSSTTTSSPTRPDELNENGSIPPSTTGTTSAPSTTSSQSSTTTSPTKPDEPNENGDVNIPLTTGSTTSPTSTTSTSSSTTSLPTKPDEANENGSIPPSTTASTSTTSSPTKPDETNQNGSIPPSTTGTSSTTTSSSSTTTSPTKPDELNENGEVNTPLTTGTTSTTSTTSSPIFTTSTTSSTTISSPTKPDEANQNGSLPPSTTGTSSTTSSPTKPDGLNENGSIPPTTTGTPSTSSTTSLPSSTTTSSPTRPDELNENGSIPPTTTGTPSTSSTTSPISTTSTTSSTTTLSPTKPDEANQNGSIPPTTTGTPSNPSTTSSPSSTTTSSPTRPDELNENGSIPPSTTGTTSAPSTTSLPSSTTTSSPTRPDELNENGSIPPSTTGVPSSTTSSPTSTTSTTSSTTTLSPTKPDETNQNGSIPPSTTGTSSTTTSSPTKPDEINQNGITPSTTGTPSTIGSSSTTSINNTPSSTTTNPSEPTTSPAFSTTTSNPSETPTPTIPMLTKPPFSTTPIPTTEVSPPDVPHVHEDGTYSSDEFPQLLKPDNTRIRNATFGPIIIEHALILGPNNKPMKNIKSVVFTPSSFPPIFQIVSDENGLVHYSDGAISRKFKNTFVFEIPEGYMPLAKSPPLTSVLPYIVNYAKIPAPGPNRPIDIFGFVWNDKGRDGRLTFTRDLPLTGTKVLLFSPNGEVISEAVTNSNGMYLFTVNKPLRGAYIGIEANIAGHMYQPTHILDMGTIPLDYIRRSDAVSTISFNGRPMIISSPFNADYNRVGPNLGII